MLDVARANVTADLAREGVIPSDVTGATSISIK